MVCGGKMQWHHCYRDRWESIVSHEYSWGGENLFCGGVSVLDWCAGYNQGHPALLRGGLEVLCYEGDDQMASSSTFSIALAGSTVGVSSLVAASSFFIIEKMNAADSRQMAMRMPQMTGTDTLPHMSMGIETR